MADLISPNLTLDIENLLNKMEIDSNNTFIKDIINKEQIFSIKSQSNIHSESLKEGTSFKEIIQKARTLSSFKTVNTDYGSFKTQSIKISSIIFGGITLLILLLFIYKCLLSRGAPLLNWLRKVPDTHRENNAEVERIRLDLAQLAAHRAMLNRAPVNYPMQGNIPLIWRNTPLPIRPNPAIEEAQQQ